MRLYLSRNGLADVKKRLSVEERERMDRMIAAGEIKIVGGKEAGKESNDAGQQ